MYDRIFELEKKIIKKNSSSKRFTEVTKNLMSKLHLTNILIHLIG